mgnify:FL=1
MNTPEYVKVNTYEFNLDLPPEERWVNILTEFKHKFRAVIPHIRSLTDNMMGMFKYPLIGLTSFMKYSGHIMFEKEILCISQYTGLSFEEVLMLQLCYEACSCCTSLVSHHAFFRTLDWPFDWLDDLTINMEFKKNGNKIFTTTGWVGFVGVMTCTVPQKYSISLNFRQLKDMEFVEMFNNMLSIVQLKYPMSYLIRNICENEMSYDDALINLTTVHIVSPCYITFCSGNPSINPKIITRGPTDYQIYEHLYVVQTNCDQGKDEPDILYSVTRRDIATNIIKKHIDLYNIDDMIRQFVRYPIINEETIFYSVMYPCSGLHTSYVRKKSQMVEMIR